MPQVITLTTDFGTADGYVGAMKGRILDMHPAAYIVDISHDITPQGVRLAAWCLKRASATFPLGTVHAAVIDPGVGSGRAAIAFESGGHWFVGPDNGVFSEIITGNGVRKGYRLHDETRWWRKHSSFDGLALFAPAAACLALGIDPGEMGRPATDFLLLETPAPAAAGSSIVGEILMFDRFGNAITNIRRTDLAGLRQKPETAVIGGRRLPLLDHYQDGMSLAGAAIINSDGLVEICVFTDSARERLELAIGDRVMVV